MYHTNLYKYYFVISSIANKLDKERTESLVNKSKTFTGHAGRKTTDTRPGDQNEEILFRQLMECKE